MDVGKMREILRGRGVRPKKELGQSFLLDEEIAGRIVDEADVGREDAVLEIGAGLGVLTELLLGRAGRVIAVEVDIRLYEALGARFQESENLTLINEDILKLDLRELWRREAAGGLKVVSNLPYHITAPVLNYILRNRAIIDLAVLTIQDEVARRAVSRPGKRDYGLLSVLIQYHTVPEILFSIQPSSFYPSPRVVSTVVRLRLRESPAVSVDERLFMQLVKASFSQRRKMLKNALRSWYSSEVLEQVSSRTGIDLRRRAETLSVSEFGRLTDALSRARGSS